MKVAFAFRLHVKTGASVWNGMKAKTLRVSVPEDLLVTGVKVCYDLWMLTDRYGNNDICGMCVCVCVCVLQT